MQDFTEIRYTIDDNDRVISVCPQWNEFALQNDGVRISSKEIIGRSLWDSIADDPTRELYAAVLALVRAGSPADLVLRCDAPGRRRLIEMIVTRQPDGNVEFKTVLLASKPRPAERLFDSATPRSGRCLMVCSWCDRVNVDEEKWFEVEAAMEYLELREEAELPRIEPVVCPACFAKMTDILARLKQPKAG